MLRALAKDSVIYGLAHAATRGVQVALVPIYTRVLAPADYGIIDMMAVAAALARPVFSLEITQGMGRLYGDAEGPAERRAYASTTLLFTVLMAVLGLAITLPLAEPLSTWLLGPGTALPFRVGAISIAAFLLFYTLKDQLRWGRHPSTHGLVSIVFAAVAASSSILLVVWCDMGVVGVFYGQLIGYCCAAALAGYASRRSYALTFDRAKWVAMVTFSGPLVFSVIGHYVALMTDRVMIKFLLGLDHLGVYGIGARFASVGGMLLSAFAAALTPLVFHKYRDASTPFELARIFRVFLGLVAPLVLFLAVFAPELVTFLTTPAYYGAASVVPILSLSVVTSGMYIFAPGMDIAKRTVHIAGLSIAVAILNVALNWYLIPRFGIRGAALGTLASAVVGFTGYMLLSQRSYPVPHPWWRLAKALGFALAVFWAGRMLDDTPSLALRLAAKFAIVTSGSLSLAYFLIGGAQMRTWWRRLRS